MTRDSVYEPESPGTSAVNPAHPESGHPPAGAAEFGRPADLPILATVRGDELRASDCELRILFFSKSKKHTRVPFHFIRAFEANGHRVHWIRTHKLNRFLGGKISRAFMNWRYRLLRPDFVFIYGKDILPGVLEGTQAVPKVVYYEDVPGADGRTFNDKHRRVFRQSSILFTTAREIMPALSEMGVPQVEFLHAGVDARDHYRVEPDPKFASDVAFIGRGSGADRVNLMKAIEPHFDLKLYGREWDDSLGVTVSHDHIFPEQYRKICASAKVMLGIDLRSDFNLYFSNRTWLTLGCGGFLLTHYVPHLEEFFVNRKHLVWYHSEEECQELIRYYLDHEEERRQIATAGFEYAHTYHTFRHAATKIEKVVREAYPLPRDKASPRD